MEVLASGLAFPEGPVAIDDGVVLVGEQGRGTITRIEPDGSTTDVVATGGAPNGLAIGPDGHLYVCNNGGLRFSTDDGRWNPIGLAEGHAGGWIQRVDLGSGQVETVFAAATSPGGRAPTSPPRASGASTQQHGHLLA